MGDLPRENLRRSATGFELRATEDGTGMPTMVINFARFNEWTEIDSFFEGRFLERMAPGAFKKTFREQADQIRPIFQHGRDPQAGSKPLGPIENLREEDDGAWADVQLLDADYVREIVPGLRAGLYGASFAFQVTREDVRQDPKPSDENPQGLPERTIKEVRLHEFGPVTFPAYAGTSTGVRSLTDDVLFDRILREEPERLRRLLDRQADEQDASSSDDEERAPADEATPALSVARRRLLLMQRRPSGTPGI